MARRSFARSRTGGARRLTDWGFLLPLAPIVIPANSFVLLGSISQALLGDSTPLTLVRTRGLAHVASDQLAGTEPQLFSHGVAVVKESARVAGAASLPDPLVDADDSVWQSWGQVFNLTQLNSAVGFDASAGKSEVIDSKSMRKVVTGESIVLMGANSHATAGLQVTIGLRFLFKLH